MFGKDFYPTPKSVIEMMVGAVDVCNKIVLEPSAGKGNIVDYLKTNGAKDILTCEIEPNLAKIVSQKSRFINSDFFDVKREDVSHIDLIIMNPPFSQDDKHILHAWEIAPPGCEIISLCNYYTLDNSFSQNRKMLNEIINYNGRYDDLGNCFSSSERETDVRVACVHLHKNGSGSDEFEGYFDVDPDMEQQEEGIVRYDYIRDIVGRYVQAVSMFDGVMKASEEVNAVTSTIYSYGIKFGAFDTSRQNYTAITRDEFKKDLQKRCWNKVFNDMKMDKYVTSGVLETINKFVEKQEHVPFTVKNVYKMVEMIVGTHSDRMGKVIIEAFDLICSFSSDNSTAGETWKTNSNYMINKRFIIPYITEADFYGTPRPYVYLTYRGWTQLNDILKGLCHLTGSNFDEIVELRVFIDKGKLEWGKWHTWEPFFRVRGYKKGTMHFEFIDEDVWAKFNKHVAKIKGWRLPNNSRNGKKNR